MGTLNVKLVNHLKCHPERIKESSKNRNFSARMSVKFRCILQILCCAQNDMQTFFGKIRRV